MSLEEAIARIESGLKEDPRIEREGPRDWLFTRRVVAWVKKLKDRPSEALLLAAWGHVLRRWLLPRDGDPQKYPMTTAGYHKWRRAQGEISAAEIEKILQEEGIGRETAGRVRDLILKKDFPIGPDAQVLEDADCLAFLELKLESYLSEWDEPKLLRILQGTLEKMSPEACKIAADLLGQKSILNPKILDKILSKSL